MGTASSIASHGAGKGKVVSQKDPQRINVLFVGNEWNSSKGGLPTFNRETPINLAKTSSDTIKVHCYVFQSTEQEREDAKRDGVNIITAKSIPGTSDPLEWLRLPPPELAYPDVVVGHGLKFGTPAYCIVQTTKCKWVQCVHVCYEDLGKLKLAGEKRSAPDTIEENEKKQKEEIKLCNSANMVVAVGSRLQRKYSRYLPDIEVEVITPGTLESFYYLSDQKRSKVSCSPDEFSIFVFGRASYEDLKLKGYDIIAGAVGSLGEKFKVTFVGAPEGQHRNIEEWFLQNEKVNRKQLTIRGYCDQNELKRMFFEADLVAMPSRTEGFGLVALEAISAGVPVLITSESGIAKALERVEGGKSVIVQSEEPKEWAQKIKKLSKKKPEKRLDNAIRLRENYNKTYSWSTQCERFSKMVGVLMKGSCHGNHVDGMWINMRVVKGVLGDVSQKKKWSFHISWIMKLVFQSDINNDS